MALRASTCGTQIALRANCLRAFPTAVDGERAPSQDWATPHWSLRNLYIARVPSAELGLALRALEQQAPHRSGGTGYTGAMHPVLLAADDCRLCSGELIALGPRLPTSAEELNELLATAVEQSLDRAFTHLSLAALQHQLPVDARHLQGGAHLLPDPDIVARIAGHCQGDVAAALVEAMKEGRLSWEREGVALLLGAWWDQEKGEGNSRKPLVRQARLLCRKSLSLSGELLVVATAQLLEDDELSELVSRLGAFAFEEEARAMRTSLLDLATRAVLDGLPARAVARSSGWRPTRRAVPRIGRNEPCPCGSGKKYKRCCQTRDEQRLGDSSDIEGVTESELRRNLEEHLTWDRLEELRAHELARLDPRRIDPGLHAAIVGKLVLFNEFQAIHRFFQTEGLASSLKDHLLDAVDAALRQHRTDDARALLELVEEPADEMGMSLRMVLLMKELEESPVLVEMERLASNVLDEDAVDFACDLVDSRWPHLGILVARGLLPVVTGFDRQTLLNSIGEARDRLDLPAIDPVENTLEAWLGDELESDRRLGRNLGRQPLRALDQDDGGDGDDSWASRESEPDGRDGSEAAPQRADVEHWQALEEKEVEVRNLRDQLSELRGLLQEQDGESSGGIVESGPEADPRFVELRERVHRLKGELNQRHAERNQLRRQLDRMRKRVDALTVQQEESTAQPGPEVSAVPTERSEEPAGPLPPRLPLFSKRFRERLTTVPEGVKRRAILTVGRIAAGDSAALRGARRLHADRDLHRQRIGRDYRLLFRFHEDELEVVDLLPRQDLERTLRELR